MAIEFNTNKVATAAEMLSAAQDNTLASKQEAKLAPLLGGESLTVTSGAMTDLEKLVARLKNESENTRQSVAQRRISILQTVLDSMADRISEVERKNLVEIEEYNMEKSGLKNDIAGYEKDMAKVASRITILDLKIQQLENAVDQAVKDGESHRKQVEVLKAQREKEQAKLDKLEGAIDSANAKISAIDVKIANCTRAIATTTLNEVASAMHAAADIATPEAERPESEAERAKTEAKAEANDISNIIHDAIDKIDGQIRKALDEAQVVKA